jgi:hypothetical protein
MGIQGAGWKPQPPAVIAKANNSKMERVTRIRAIRPGFSSNVAD